MNDARRTSLVDGRALGDAPIAAPDDVERALATAYAERRACAEVSTGRRVETLLDIAAAVRRDAESLAELIVHEVAKPIDFARAEVGRAARTFEAAALAAGSMRGEIRPLDFGAGAEGREALVRRVPAGVVAAITPFNFPLNLVAHKVAPAIAAGCPILVKPAPAAPLSALRLAAIAVACGRPAEWIRVLPLADDAHAAPLVEDRRVRVLTFTGSAEVGWRLRDRAREKIVGPELGGDAFAIVEPDADVARAAARCVFGGYAFAGQSCIAVQHVLVARPVFAAFKDALIREVDAVRTGDPTESGVLVGPVLRDRDADRITRWVDEARVAGARVLRDSGRDGRLLGPKLLEGVPQETALGSEEAFGPVLTLAAYDDLGEVVARVNRSRYGLQAGVFTRDLATVRRLARELEVGGLVVDDVPTLRFDAAPYGGVKASGLGREGPAYALEWMTERKTVVW